MPHPIVVTLPSAGGGASAALACVTVDRREDVDRLLDAAVAAGGIAFTAPVDAGHLYGRAFLDVDGRAWEVVWVDDTAVSRGPHGYAVASAA